MRINRNSFFDAFALGDAFTLLSHVAGRDGVGHNGADVWD